MMSGSFPLRGKHVRLEELAQHHVDGLVGASAADLSLYKWSPVPQGKAATVQYVDTAGLEKCGFGCAIPGVRMADGVVIGSTRFWNLERQALAAIGREGVVASLFLFFSLLGRIAFRRLFEPSYPFASFPSMSFPSGISLAPVVRFGFFFFFRIFAAIRRRRVRFIGVIGDVPARSFELHGRRRNHLLNFAAALRALLDHFVGELLNFLEAVTAFFALIFVKRHVLLNNCEAKSTSYRF